MPSTASPTQPFPPAAAELARNQMIEQQVRAWDVLDNRVLDVLRRVRREEFAPPAWRDVAFADSTIPIGHGQVMLPPKVDGRILAALAVAGDDEVLDVGTGSGFLAACLGKLGARVRSLEIVPDLAETARRNLHTAAVNNVIVDIGDGLGLTDTERYDAIAVTGSLPEYDERFARALKVGGRLFLVVGQAPVMSALKITRTGSNEWTRETLFETVIPPLLNARQPSRFVF